MAPKRREEAIRAGERLQAARGKRGLTQHDLAAAVGVHDTVVSRWEGGRAKPSARYAHLLAEALGVEMSWLLFGDEPPRATGTEG